MAEHRFCSAVAPVEISEAELELVRRQRAALLLSKKWEAQSTITVAFVEGSRALRDRVEAVAREWTKAGRANLSLRFVEGDDGDIRIAFQQGAGSWSYIGTDCARIPAGQPTMNYGWLTDDSPDDELRRVVLHEFGHALGLIHEHQNPKSPIKWNKDAVYNDLSGPPNNWEKDVIDRNMFDTERLEDVSATEVDEKSIMMYPIPPSWTTDGFSAGLNGDLSPQDEALISNEYP